MTRLVVRVVSVVLGYCLGVLAVLALASGLIALSGKLGEWTGRNSGPRTAHAIEGQVFEVAAVFNGSAPGGLGILDVHGGQPVAGYTPRYGNSALRVTVKLATTGTLSLVTKGGATTKTSVLNGGADLTAANLYTFTCGIRQSSGATSLTYDFVLGTDGIVDVFLVEEVYGPVTYPSPAQGGSGSSTITGDVTVIGKAADGAAVSGNPVLVAGSDGTNAERLLVDSSGRPNVVGPVAAGATAAGNPVGVAGVDSGSLATRPRTDGAGRWAITPGLSFLDATPTALDATQDGTNTVTLLAGSAGTVIYPTTLMFSNTSTTTAHTVSVYSGSGAGTRLLRFYLPATTTAAFDLRGDVRCLTGQALLFTCAAAGTDVVASGAAIRQ